MILFGYHARGDATDDSDVDVMVVEENVTNRMDEIGAAEPIGAISGPRGLVNRLFTPLQIELCLQ